MEEESEPWEVQLLKDYCNSDASLESLGYAQKSVLAGAWYVATQNSVDYCEVCLCGGSLVEQCVVRQWVEYYVSKIRKETVWDALSRDELQRVMEELNSHLVSRVFMVGTKLTLADIMLYYGLHRYMAGMSFIQKAEYIHVCRWFDYIQHFPGVRPFSLPLVVFHKSPDLLTL